MEISKRIRPSARSYYGEGDIIKQWKKITTPRFYDVLMKQANREWLNLIEKTRNQSLNILEVGPAARSEIQEMAKNAGNQAIYHALDFTPEMVKGTRDLIRIKYLAACGGVRKTVSGPGLALGFDTNRGPTKWGFI